MRRVALLGFCLASALSAWSLKAQEPAHLVAPTGPRTPEEQRKMFRLPPGFAIELVAAEPDIAKPMNLAFDDKGRLWVTQTLEYPYPAPAGRRGRDAVKILDDFDATGRARKVTTFADGLNIPIGVLPLTPHEALVHTIPHILRARDTDGDGIADKREIGYAAFGSADTHGMTNAFSWGFDGWVYATHGFSNTSTVQGADGRPVTLQSGNTYRMRPDGSRVEQYTWGQVNPFGLSFDPLGNLYSADCHSQPVYQLLRGAWYPSFGKPHDGLGFGPETTDNDHGSTAIAGIAYYAADHFPKEYRDTLYIGNVVTNRVNHDRIDRRGSSSWAVRQPDFLTCDDPWFRPVDLKVGPDGALYIADFYNKIIGHYEVRLDHPGRDRHRGRIWRVVYRGPDGKGKPQAPRRDWTRASVAELIADLSHPNLGVRTTATNQLVTRRVPLEEAARRSLLAPSSKPEQRMHGVWVLERLGLLDDQALTGAAADAYHGVRVHAMRVLSERKELSEGQRRLVRAALQDADAFVRRAAADALGRHPDPDNVRPLLDLLHATPSTDTHLIHTARMALRDQLRPAANWAKLPTSPWTEKDTQAVARVALGVPSAEAAGYLLAHLDHLPGRAAENVRHVARYGSPEAVRQVLGKLSPSGQPDLRREVSLFKAVQQGTQERGTALPPPAREWGERLTKQLLADKAQDLVLAGVDLAGTFKTQEIQQTVLTLAQERQRPDAQRRAALATLANVNPAEHVALFGRLLADAGEPFAVREQAALSLSSLNQRAAQEEVTKCFALVPARLQTVLANGLAASPQGAEKLLDAVAAGKASARLLQEPGVQIRFERVRVPNVRERVALLTKGLPPADQRLVQLIQQRRDGFAQVKPSAESGAKVFEKSCAICHQLGGKGTKVGPQLDGVGVRGLDRLLEDTLDPNRNVDQAFRATTLALKNGQVLSGLVLREEGAVLVLADAQGKEVRVPKDTVEERSVSQLSPMPSNLADQIGEADFHHLMAYLLTQRPQAPNR